MTKVADEILGKVARQQADVFARICNGGLSPERFFRVNRQLLNILTVKIVHRGWTKAVESGNYGSRFTTLSYKFTVEDLPLLDELEAGCELCLRKQDQEASTTRAWRKSLDENEDSKERFAHPLKVLAIGYDEFTKNELMDGAIFTTWTSPRTGLLWSLTLDADSSGRCLSVVDLDPDSVEWDDSCRAAVVAKSLKTQVK